MDSDDVIQSWYDDVMKTITSQRSLSGENSFVPDGSKSITDRSVNENSGTENTPKVFQRSFIKKYMTVVNTVVSQHQGFGFNSGLG